MVALAQIARNLCSVGRTAEGVVQKGRERKRKCLLCGVQDVPSLEAACRIVTLFIAGGRSPGLLCPFLQPRFSLREATPAQGWAPVSPTHPCLLLNCQGVGLAPEGTGEPQEPAGVSDSLAPSPWRLPRSLRVQAFWPQTHQLVWTRPLLPENALPSSLC